MKAPVTNDKSGFKRSPIPVFTPTEFTKHLSHIAS